MGPIPRTSRYGRDKWTTGQISRLLDVTTQTVINWISAGKLKAERIEGGPRKVKIRDLVQFMVKNDIPVSEELLYQSLVSKPAPIGGYRVERPKC